MSFTQVITYNSAPAFTIDSLAEVTTRAALTDLTPADATSWATFTDNDDLNGGSGLRAGSLEGGAVISGNKLVMNNGNKSYCDFSGVGNGNFTQTGTYKWKLTPLYSGIPGNDQQLIYAAESEILGNNVISLFHRTSLFMQLLLTDSAGSGMLNVSLAQWVPVSGQTYEFMLCFDIDAVTPASTAVRLFIDGTQHDATQTGFAGTRSADTGLIRIGANGVGTPITTQAVEDLIIFDTVQETGNYTPGYTLPEGVHSLIPQSIIETAGQLTDGAEALAEGTAVTPAGTSLEYNYNADGVDYSYNTVTSAWEIAASSADTNTLIEFNANAASFDASLGVIFRRKLWLKTTNSDNTPLLSTSTLTYSYFETIGTLAFCIVSGYITDNGTAVEGGTVTFKTVVVYGTDNTTTSVNRIATSRSNGYYEAPLIQGTQLEVKMVWTDSNDKRQSKEGVFTVPATDQADLEDLI